MIDNLKFRKHKSKVDLENRVQDLGDNKVEDNYHNESFTSEESNDEGKKDGKKEEICNQLSVERKISQDSEKNIDLNRYNFMDNDEDVNVLNFRKK